MNIKKIEDFTSLANFFDGYYDLVMQEFDNEDNLFSLYNCYEDFE